MFLFNLAIMFFIAIKYSSEFHGVISFFLDVIQDLK